MENSEADAEALAVKDCDGVTDGWAAGVEKLMTGCAGADEVTEVDLRLAKAFSAS